MPKRSDRPVHPSKLFYQIALFSIACTILLEFIAVFVPQARKDIAPGTRLHAFPFKLCFEDTTSALNAYACQDSSFSNPNSVSGGSTFCRGYIVATIVFVFLTVIGSLLFTVPALIAVLCLLWGRPIFLALLTQILLFFSVAFAALSVGMFIVYAEDTCAPNSPIFPVRGYSYGFVCDCFATGFALLAFIMGYLGLQKLLTWKPFIVENAEAGGALYPAEKGSAPPTAQGPMAPYMPPAAPAPFPGAGYLPAGIPTPYGY